MPTLTILSLHISISAHLVAPHALQCHWAGGLNCQTAPAGGAIWSALHAQQGEGTCKDKFTIRLSASRQDHAVCNLSGASHLSMCTAGRQLPGQSIWQTPAAVAAPHAMVGAGAYACTYGPSALMKCICLIST